MSTKDAIREHGESQHTPGPWEPRQNESGMYVTCVNEQHVDSDGDPSDICSVENEDYFGAEQAWDNARLIASAPALLAQRDAPVAALEDALPFVIANQDGSEIHKQRLAAMRAVLKAAKVSP
jgi:hypothetical protein